MQSFELCMATDVLPGARQDENLPVNYAPAKYCRLTAEAAPLTDPSPLPPQPAALSGLGIR